MRRAFKHVAVVCLLLSLAATFSPVLGQELVNMEFKEAPLVDVFQILGQLGGYNVLVDPQVRGEVSFVLNNLPVEEALDLVTRTTGYRYKLMGNTLIVASEQRLESEFGTLDVSFVPIENVDVEAARELVSLVVPSVKSYVDEDLSLLVLYGLTSDLRVAEQVLRQYDQRAQGAAPVVVEVAAPVSTVSQMPELEARRIAVRYADGADVLDLARRQLPQRDFSWDEATRTLSGFTTVQEWTAVRQLVEENDLPKFVLRGILSSQAEKIALVEYQGTTTSLREGEFLHDWEAAAIEGGAVSFRQGEKSFTIRMGR